MRYIFILFVFSVVFIKSQINYVTISHDTSNLLIDTMDPTILTSDKDVTISGKLLSGTYFIVRPTNSYRIILKPKIPDITKPEDGNGGTVIGKSGGGIGKITIAPNPVTEKLHVVVEHTKMTGYKIVDINGYIYMQNNSIAPIDKYDINVIGLPTGNYILTVTTTSGQILSEHFIKQ